MKSKNIISIATGIAVAASVALALPAFAQTSQGNNGPWQWGPWQGRPGQPGQGQQFQGQGQGQGHWSGIASSTGMFRGAPGGVKPAVFGTVASVDGDIITVDSRTGFGTTSATTTYTVDATNATVRKANATSTVSAISTGDFVVVQGTVSGTDVTATSIIDGMFGRGGMTGAGGPGMMGPRGHASSTPPIIQGNGQPVVAGTVSMVSGDSIDITTSSNVSYTIDASSAAVVKGNASSTVSAISVGDYIVVQGAVNGTSVTASSIIDQPTHPANGNSSNDNGDNGHNIGKPAGGMGFLGSIGSFFKHLFGF